MKPAHLLFILSDQHNRDMSGCYGHPLVQTPHLDSLAERGTRFTNAYTPSPLCVPARAALATGRYVHQTGYWDNGIAYDGRVPSWGHRLKAQGYQIDSIGKLHFRSQEDDNGFTQEIDPLHVVNGVGDILSCIRDNPPFRQNRDGILGAGPGDSTYLHYDASNADRACRWLAQHAHDDKPWVLFLSFVCPHPPYIAPEELYKLYPLDQVPMPIQWRPEEWPVHPVMQHFRQFFNFSEPYNEATIRKLRATYFGVITYLDRQIGRVLAALDENGLTETTRIIYTSDHGDSMGARGNYGKITMYEEAAAIPFIMAGPDVPQNNVVNTPISLIDCFPTVLKAVGASPASEDADLPGESLWQIAGQPDRERTVFSEFHAISSRNAIYMLRNRQYKYIHYLYDLPQLFDLHNDPNELSDLTTSPAHQVFLQDFEQELRLMLNPEAVDAQAKADQQAKVEAFGGRDAVLVYGAFPNSPVPGEKPDFRRYT